MTVVDEVTYQEPTYWDDAAHMVITEIMAFALVTMNKISDMRTQLDFMISRNSISNPSAWMENEEMADFWKILAAAARNTAGSKKIDFFGFNPSNVQYSDLPELSSKFAGLVTRKQRDYGCDNILRFGRFGLLVRVHDKIARLENLEATGTAPNNESIVDNYMDVIGYCTVAVMFERGWFTLPLRGA
jgi:hypothetical protein